MNQQPPDFEQMLQSLADILERAALPTSIIWVFRESMYQTSREIYIRTPIPTEKYASLARRAFVRGQEMNQVRIHAVARLGERVAATIWYPRSEKERPQGWDHGFRVSHAIPLHSAVAVGSTWQWWLRTRLPAYRRYQQYPHHMILAAREVG